MDWCYKNMKSRLILVGSLVLKSSLLCTLLGVGSFLDAADESDDSEGVVEQVISIGTRVPDRTDLNSLVPVDVFNQSDIESMATSVDMTELIQKLVPSFNVSREPISDGATFVRPPFVRGLDSDKLLVLIDGKRRHKSALVRIGGSGTHGVDLASIPAIAVESIEVLRDGASAQYGTDAIAGVMNFNLKDASRGSQSSFTFGEYAHGGGDYRLATNLGLEPVADSFLNVSAEYAQSRGTSRGQRYDLAVRGGSGLTPQESAAVAVDTDGDGIADRFGPDSYTEIFSEGGHSLSLVPGADGIPDDTTPRYAENLPVPEQNWGQPQREDAKLFINTAITVKEDLMAYAFVNWRSYKSNGDFFYRRPGIAQLAPIRLEDGRIFHPRDRFPGGFTPRFFGHLHDFGWVSGIRTENTEKLNWDLSLRTGVSQIDYLLRNTWNPSLGPASPTEFRPGGLESREYSLNADFDFYWQGNFAHPIHFAFGFERSKDSYAIEAGDPASYAVGPFARVDPYDWEITEAEAAAIGDPRLASCRIPGHEDYLKAHPDMKQPGGECIVGDPIYSVMGVGSNGFPGYSHDYTVDYSRTSWSTYLDLEARLNKRLESNLAFRLANFEDFGTVLTGKLSVRVAFTDRVAWRASVNTGFRAPTSGQLATVNVSTRINAEGIPVAQGIFPPSHPVSQYFGAQSLVAERSFHVATGLILSYDTGWSQTLDVYHIVLSDRLTLSSPFVVDDEALAALTARGVESAASIAQVNFFTNALEARSRGLDLVSTYRFDNTLGPSSLTLHHNQNRVEITKQDPVVGADGGELVLINEEGLFDFRHTWPKYRSVATWSQDWRDYVFMLRVSAFGPYKNASNASLTTIQEFDGKVQWDMQVDWQINSGYRLTVSGVNIFDAVPDDAQFEACCGRIVRSDSLIPWQGPYFSARLTINN